PSTPGFDEKMVADQAGTRLLARFARPTRNGGRRARDTLGVGIEAHRSHTLGLSCAAPLQDADIITGPGLVSSQGLERIHTGGSACWKPCGSERCQCKDDSCRCERDGI